MKDINFLVSESSLEKGNLEKQSRDTTAQKIVIIILSITFAVAILFVPSIILQYYKSQVQTVEKQMIDVKYREVRSVKAQHSSITAKVDEKKTIIKSIESQSVPASQILVAIDAALPAGCYLSNVNFDGNSLEIKGFADSSLLAAEFMGNLDRLSLFTRVTEGIQLEQTQSPVTYSISYIVSEDGGK